jgi:hypothetical protein
MRKWRKAQFSYCCMPQCGAIPSLPGLDCITEKIQPQRVFYVVDCFNFSKEFCILFPDMRCMRSCLLSSDATPEHHEGVQFLLHWCQQHQECT